MARFFQVTTEGKRFSKPFIPVHSNGSHKMACCDCGLVHDMKFSAWLKVYKGGKLIGYQSLSRRHVVVMVAARRNERATAGRRKAKKLKNVAAAIKKSKP